LANDGYGQAGWLNQILNSSSDEIKRKNIEFVFSNLSEELYERLKGNKSLVGFINDVLKLIQLILKAVEKRNR
jgi:hypothetical protein